jgi:hypothetical protein
MRRTDLGNNTGIENLFQKSGKYYARCNTERYVCFIDFEANVL